MRVPDCLDSEEAAWYALTPQERFFQYTRLLEFYLKAGGSLAPQRDSQSPFDFPEYYEQKSPQTGNSPPPAIAGP
jgi:hypothetical protein